MRTSVKLVLRTDKKRADGSCPIWIRATAHRKSRYATTGIFVNKSVWDEKRQAVRSKHELAPTLNATLGELMNRARQVAYNGGSPEAVIAAVKGTGGSLTDYFGKYISQLEARGKFWEWKKYRVTLVKLKRCFGESIDWREMDRAAIEKFATFLDRQCENGPNTVRKELQRLRRVYKEAVRDDLVEPGDDPFLKYRAPKSKPVHRRKLTESEIKSLAEVKLDGLEATARDAFLFSYYANGMRFGDLCRLKPGSVRDGRLRYVMMKTGTPIEFKLPTPAQALIQRQPKGPYLWPFLKPGDEDDEVRLRRRIASANTRVNRALKSAAEKAGVDPDGLSFHVARHSFADYARRNSDNLYAISKGLGHQRLQTTETYLAQLDQRAIDQLSDNLWGNDG